MFSPTTYYRPSKRARVLPVDDQLDYLTGHYRHLTGTTYPGRPVTFKLGPIERRPAELQAADLARRQPHTKEEPPCT